MADSVASPFGVVTHVISDPGWLPAQRDLALELAAQAGVAWIREEIRWDVIQPTPGPFQWDVVDAVVNKAAEQNLQILGLLDYNNQAFAAPPNHLEIIDPPAIGPWTDYVTAVVTRYQDRIHAWEVWNEPDVPGQFWLGTVREYVDLLSATHATIKGIDPNATVLNGGLSNMGLGFFREFLDLGGAQFADVFALHPYVATGDLDGVRYEQNVLADIRDAIVASPRPIWFTEFGWSAAPKNGASNDFPCVGSEHAQANYVVRQYIRSLHALGLDVERAFLYGLRNGGTDPANPEHNYGLVGNDFAVKEAFTAYQQLSARLIGAAPRDIVNAGVGRAYRFRRNGVTLDVVWGNGVARLPTTATSAQAFDMMGNALAADVTSGQIRVALGDDPVYVEHIP